MVTSAVPESTREERIWTMAHSVLPDGALFVLDVRIRGQKGTPVVDVVIDGDRGVDIGTCAQISRRLQATLAVAGVFPQGFSLTVSSPGADRPLVLPRQYRKHVGRPLSVVLRGESGEEVPLEGMLKEVADDHFLLETQEGDRAVQYDIVSQARVKLPW